jgi:hypothetical protein
MFIGYQNNTAQFMAESREELENMPCVVLDKIEEVEFAELYDGKIYTDKEELAKVKAITRADLTAFVSAEADKVASGGFTIVQGENQYLFKTTTENITRCNSVLAMFQVLPADTVIPWEVWQGDVPTMLSVNAEQFKACFAFGSQMIISVESVKGAINAEVQKLTDEQLADDGYITAFKENAVMQLNAVNTVFELR